MIGRFSLFTALAVWGALPGHAVLAQDLRAGDAKTRIAVVSSYHREYLWSQDTNSGVVSALLDFGYLDEPEQGAVYTRTDWVESSTAVVRKLWMDSKRRSTPADIKAAVANIVRALEDFRPHIVLLGDDNATNYVGNHYMDTKVPVVFWGVNGSPLKYRLLDSIERPGHNVTGIYQAGYLKEGVHRLTQLVPGIKRMAVLSDGSPTGRAKAKEISRLFRQGELPVILSGSVVTNSLATWKARALELREQVDAFFVLNHNTLKRADGSPVDQLEVGAWYLREIKKPDVSHERQFVLEGVLCAVDDSGYKQGYEAVRVAHRILAKGEAPGNISAYAPPPGGFVVNLERAKMLGLRQQVEGNPLVDETVEHALALTARR